MIKLTKEDAERIIDEDGALDRFLRILRLIKMMQYEQFFENVGACRVLRNLIEKNFVAMHDFEATYHELYKTYIKLKAENAFL